MVTQRCSAVTAATAPSSPIASAAPWLNCTGNPAPAQKDQGGPDAFAARHETVAHALMERGRRQHSRWAHLVEKLINGDAFVFEVSLDVHRNLLVTGRYCPARRVTNGGRGVKRGEGESGDSWSPVLAPRARGID